MRLSKEQVQQFHTEGYCRIDNAFSADIARACREELWRRLKGLAIEPDDPRSWKEPVVRLGMFTSHPFIEAANGARLLAAFDDLVGAGRWRPCMAVGDVVVRFPSAKPAGDVGWHVDMSFGHEDPDFMNWRINRPSRGRALLLLLLFSTVGVDDAPTMLRVGSHHRIATLLESHGAAGLSLQELIPHFSAMEDLPVHLATGTAGTAYLVHPFLVHSAQAHRGSTPRFLAQPALFPAQEPGLDDDARA